MAHDPRIANLLKQLRSPEPPPEYFEDFLHEFRRRRRADLLRCSVWEILWDRFISFAPTFRVPQVAYAAIAIAAVGASATILTHKPQSSGPVAAANLSLSTTNPVTITTETVSASARPGAPIPSHYVLQSRPVDNEQPLSF